MPVSRRFKIFNAIILSFMFLVVMIPLIFVLLTAFTRTDLIGKSLWPEKFVWDNFSTVLFKTPFIHYMLNTLFVSIIVAVGNMFFNSMAAYAFSRMDFPFRNAIFYLLIATLILPQEVTLLPLYMLMNEIGWVDTYAALIIPKIASIFWIFFLRQSFLGLPKDLENAAQIDGCSWFQIYLRIILPLVKGPLFTSGLLAFFGVWDEYLWPITIINTASKNLVQVAVTVLDTEFYVNVGARYANVVLCALPTIILFIFLQKQYIAGVTAGSVKE